MTTPCPILVCAPALPGRTSVVPGATKRPCTFCAIDLWIAPTAMKLIDQGVAPVCVLCVGRPAQESETQT